MIEAAVEQKADAIVISASSSDGVIPAIQSAKDAGIKVVNFDTRISDTSVIDAFVGGDDVAGAYKAGKYICEKLGGEGQVAIVTGLMEQSTGVDRHAGFMAACEEYPGIEVVAEQGAAWASDQAYDVTTNILTANPDVKAIFACNDQMAMGMVSAAKAAGKTADDLVLVGYDGILDAVNMVVDGDLDAFVALPNLDEGAMGIKLATALILNEDYAYVGVAIIYQELSLMSELSVMENVYMSHEQRKFANVIDYKQMYKDTEQQLKRLNADHINPKTQVKLVIVASHPVPVMVAGIPDEDVPNGEDAEVFTLLHLDVSGIYEKAKELMKKKTI